MPLTAVRRIRRAGYRTHAVLPWAGSFLVHALGAAICLLTPAGPGESPASSRQPPEPLPACGIAFVPLSEPVAFERPPERVEELPPIEAHVPKPEPIEPEPLDDPPEPPLRELKPPPVPDDRREPVPPEIPEPLPPRPPVAPPPPEPVPPTHVAKPPEERKAPRKAAEPPLPPSAGSERATVRARPDCVHNPPPAYPRAARRRGYEGLVLLLVRVSAAGVSLSVEVKESSGHPVLDRAAVKAVQRWRFKPATADGKPTAGEVEVPIRFKLTD